jgi:hypothetical protein
LKKVGIEVAGAQAGDELSFVQSLEDEVDPHRRKLTLQEQSNALELRVDVVEQALQLKTAGPSSRNRRPHRQSGGIQPFARPDRVCDVRSRRSVVGPVERPYRIVCDLSAISHTLRHDFVAIDRIGYRSSHFLPRQDRVAKIEDERNVKRLDR